MITDPLAQLLRRVEELKRRTRHIVYQGTVTDVDASKRMCVSTKVSLTTTPIHKTDCSTGSSSQEAAPARSRPRRFRSKARGHLLRSRASGPQQQSVR